VSAGLCEIEVKYRIGDLPTLECALADRGVVLSDPVHQDDQAYAERGWAYGQPRAGVTFTRLRTQGGRHLFTVKRPLDNEMACVEHETEVADRAVMHQALLAMGFVPTVRIVKIRRTAAIGDVAVCVDDVERAGLFLEMERLVGAESAALTVQAELDGIARSLGVPMQRVSDTYDSLVRAHAVSA
jgi:adenylate cyclase, class 2